jgi:putative PIN family toxin of toxin-antitoxin system
MKNSETLDIVLDTNILLVAVPDTSPYHWIMEVLLYQKVNLYISNDILKEYEEQLKKRYDEDIADEILSALLLLPNVIQTNVYYNWHLIHQDEDDNKFVDCAVASNAHYLVSNDSHFKVLKDIPIPKVNILTLDEFDALYNSI